LSKELLTINEISELEARDERFRLIIAQNLLTMKCLLKKNDSSWGQAKLAEFFGVSISTYKRWEKDGVDGLTVSFLTKYKRLFMLCCGDAEKEAEKEVVDEFMMLFDKCFDLLKMPSMMVERRKIGRRRTD